MGYVPECVDCAVRSTMYEKVCMQEDHVGQDHVINMTHHMTGTAEGAFDPIVA